MVVEFAVGHLPVHNLRMSVIQLAGSSLFPDSQVGMSVGMFCFLIMCGSAGGAL